MNRILFSNFSHNTVMPNLRLLFYILRHVSLRKCYFIAILCGIVLCYISFNWSTTENSQSHQGAWQIKALQRSILAQTEARVFLSPHQRQKNDLNSQLLKMLLKIEKQWKESSGNRKKIVEVRGRGEDLKFYEKVLSKHEYQVVYQDSILESFNLSLTRFGRKDKLEFPKKSSGWLLLLCLVQSDVPCLHDDEMVSLKTEQKVNVIPGLKNILSKRSAFCSAMAMAKQIPELRHDSISPLCFVLPRQFSQLVHVTQALGYSVKWTVKSSFHNKSKNSLPYILDLFNGQDQLNRLHNQKVVVQQLYDNQMLISNHTFSVRVYILITSISPLRAYVHEEGILFHRHGAKKNYKKIPGKMWLLSEFWSYLAKYNGGQDSVKIAISNLSHVLLKMLLILEAAMLSPFPLHDHKTCQHGFQLIAVDCIFNKSLHPIVLAVSNQLAPKKSAKYAKVQEMMKTLLDDVINLLLPPFKSVAGEVASALQGIETDIGLLDWSCALSNDICLSEQDLSYMMHSRRKTLVESGFRQLYPSSDASRYQGLVEQLQRQFTNEQSIKMWFKYRRHGTADLHRLLISLERWYEGTFVNEYNTDIDVTSAIVHRKPYNTSRIGFEKQSKKIVSKISTSKLDYSEEYTCTNDPASAPYLSSISSHPSLSLHPPFDPSVTDYSGRVPFQVMLIQVWASVFNCQSEARMDDRFGTARPSNVTLGVGDNRISFVVVDISLTEPRAINTYSLIIHRLPLTHGEEPFNPQNYHQICSLKQECDMPLFYNEGCGIQKDKFHFLTWPRYLEGNSRKPLCNIGDAQGRWVMPCNSCSNHSTCYWKQAAWHPYHCRYQVIKSSELRKCLRNRKLLFIGDSTNRGMMHYLIERVNGSLREWDKTHDIRLYSNINNGSTMVSFAYYPQFWIPTNERPLFDKALYQLIQRNINNGSTMVSFAYYPQFWIPTNERPLFDKALYQLIQRSRPLENNSNTILIVGGVHWLATQHLYMLLRVVRVERLHGIKLVMKTLGAGFHQPVDNVHSLSVVDQHKLILHNQGLSEFARHHNFEVIDTFNMTSARYKDFMQGKCACHFHRVVEITPQDKKHKSHKLYHVEGTINAIYSEILLSQLCSKKIKES